MKKYKYILFLVAFVLFFYYLLSAQRIYHAKNGSVLVLIPESSPFVAINIFIRDYKAKEYKKGLANLSLQMLKSGTDDKTKLDIARELEKMGGEISCTVANDYGLISGFVLKENIQEYCGLLQEIILNSTYPQKELERLKSEITVQLLQQKEDPLRYAFILNRSYNYPNHYYGYPAAGEINSLSAITNADLISYNIKESCAADVLVIVNGDFKKWQIKRSLLELLNTFNSKIERKISHTERMPYPAQDKIVDLGYGVRNILYNLKFQDNQLGMEYLPLHNLVDGYLGDGLTSPLFTAFREKNGISYAIGTVADFNRDAQLLTIYLQTREKNLKLIIEEIENILKFNDISQQVFKKIKSYHLTNYFQTQQSLVGRGRTIGYYLLRGQKLKYNYPQKIAKIMYPEFLNTLKSLTKINIFVLK